MSGCGGLAKQKSTITNFPVACRPNVGACGPERLVNKVKTIDKCVVQRLQDKDQVMGGRREPDCHVDLHPLDLHFGPLIVVLYLILSSLTRQQP